MDLLSLLMVVLAIGLLFTAFYYLPIPQPFKNILLAAVCVILALWLLGMIGHIRL